MVNQQEIDKAVELLRQGDLVAFPTETVYGLGADARSPDALRKIFAAKKRPIDHPLIVHLANTAQLSLWARDIPPIAWQLAEAYWPGPLTLILKKNETVSNLVTGNQDTIGLRIPNHPVALALLTAFGSGLAAPSANRFGRISPTTAAAVEEELGDTGLFILEGGQSVVGVESTILDVSSVHPRILRPGMITAEQIETVLHASLMGKKDDAPRVSGSLDSHYAPRTTTRLMSVVAILAHAASSHSPVAILSHSLTPKPLAGVTWVVMSNQPKQYAHDLYQTLRLLDKQNLHQIMIESVPAGREWDAIRDRLQRASHTH